MKQHFISATIAATLAAAISYEAPSKVTQVTHAVYLSKHAWPDLTDPQSATLSAALAPLKGAVKIDIVCNDAGCSDLAADIDDACERAGVDSVLDKALGPLGYGLGVQVDAADQAAAGKVAAALKTVGLDAPIIRGSSAPGYVAILIGKHRRSDDGPQTTEDR